jgi:hypothetical protein
MPAGNDSSEEFGMGSTVDTSGVSRQVWQRLVQKGDSNADSRLDKAELDALQAGAKTKTDMAALITSFDRDGDAALTAEEMPAAALTSMSLGTMLDYQTYAAADQATRDAREKEIVDALFARADVNGDDVLSKDEVAAERAMRQARSLAGLSEEDDPVFLMRYGANQDALTRSDVLVGCRVPASMIKRIPPEQIPIEIRQEIEKHVAEYRKTHPEEKPLTPEERRAQTVQRVLSTPLDSTYLTRLLAQLSAAVGTVRTQDQVA